MMLSVHEMIAGYLQETVQKAPVIHAGDEWALLIRGGEEEIVCVRTCETLDRDNGPC